MEAGESQDEAVLAANEAFYRAFNQKDVEVMEGVWSSNDEIGCIHPGWNLIKGRKAVLESWRNILTNPSQPRIVIGGASVIYADGAALVLCRELVAGSPLAATNVFVREGGDWKLVHHQSGPVAAM